jgi:hypothetical protein
MLEYSKLILEKVSFDRRLFEKEFRKALRQLVGTDRAELQKWAASKFGYTNVALAY